MVFSAVRGKRAWIGVALQTVIGYAMTEACGRWAEAAAGIPDPLERLRFYHSRRASDLPLLTRSTKTVWCQSVRRPSPVLTEPLARAVPAASTKRWSNRVILVMSRYVVLPAHSHFRWLTSGDE
jgi:hypothetical protein